MGRLISYMRAVGGLAFCRLSLYVDLDVAVDR
jgi:hypothetical protein